MNKDWILVRGVVEQGHQVASGISEDTPFPKGTIEIQKAFFKDLGLDLSELFNGTLNISISPKKFIISNPEFTFLNVKWIDTYPPENFSFSCCQIIFAANRYYGFIYYPHPETKITHFQNPSTLEILAPFIPGLQYGTHIELKINSREIMLIE
ncbi:MAG: hypothetical protein QNJ51_27495 [Calothrix sp. MO_167.B12]|nr:hypothetical protein [Calothrix sp. MO_167.B12]